MQQTRRIQIPNKPFKHLASSPRICSKCGEPNCYNAFRYGSTGITFFRCTECGKKSAKLSPRFERI